MKTICVLGLGYIGLPTAAMFATHGFDVLGVDIKDDIITTLQNGEIHIDEPGLKTLVRGAINSGNLNVSPAPAESDVFIIAVPTPITDQKKANLRFVESAARAIVPYLRKGNLVILEATSPPRTTIDLVQPILEESGYIGGNDFLLAYSPERVLPGKILQELVHNSRVIGGVNVESAEKGRLLYQSFVEGEIILTDTTTAEMVKLMENTYRDINIAAANEFSKLAHEFNVNVWEAIDIANLHPRVNILKPGPGVGGHCISVDPWFFVEKAPQISGLIKQARNTNDSQPGFYISRLLKDFDSLKGKTFTVLGLTYKPDVDDIRESPAMVIVNKIQELGGYVKVYDPYLSKGEPDQPFLKDNLDEALSDSQGILLLVDHHQFLGLQPEEISKGLKNKYIFDARNVINKEQWEAEGFVVRILGDGRDD